MAEKTERVTDLGLGSSEKELFYNASLLLSLPLSSFLSLSISRFR